jgi:tetratricopeptide (TPR) repeat protein/SAM-dependent methyltransferase
MSNTPPPVQDVRPLLVQATTFHRQGQLHDAARLYRDILAQAPGQFDALHMLGLIEHQHGNHALAADLIGKAVAIDARYAPAHLNLGNAYRGLGRHRDALASYERALALRPDDPLTLNNRGIALRDLGRARESLAAYTRALTLRPDYADAHLNLGIAQLELGQADAALASFERALGFNPQFAAAHLLRGKVLYRRQRFEDAMASYGRALDAQPGFVDALEASAELFATVGRPADALAHYAEALTLAPGREASWRAFALLVSSTDKPNAALAPLILGALQRETLDPQNAERAATGLICQDPLVQRFLHAPGTAAAPAAPIAQALRDGTLLPVLELPLLRAVLENAIITSPPLQALLAALRRALLEGVLQEEAWTATPAVEGFASALAVQCFANEYILPESADETTGVEALLARTTDALARGASLPPSGVALLAAYRPLFQLPVADRLEAALPPGHALGEVLKRQWHEPDAEARLKVDIPVLAAIDDAVSNAVREQYEENPYPRWRRRAVSPPQHTPDKLRELFPLKNIATAFPTVPDILVAGCGTGSHPVLVSRGAPAARIVAADLSLASLAYARRHSAALGITNLEFVQADILKLGELKRSFDVIECVGVLHHMQDPMAGWRVLTDLLRPGGYMFIGLYSRTARRSITAAREFIRQRGYPPTPVGIREARQALLAGDSGLPMEELTGFDFHSTSSCRDLLFNVQEHLFTPRKIAGNLVTLKLEFLGFILQLPAMAVAYRKRFPDDPAMTSLGNWETFEQEHPSTFFGMYQFWVRKRA